MLPKNLIGRIIRGARIIGPTITYRHLVQAKYIQSSVPASEVRNFINYVWCESLRPMQEQSLDVSSTTLESGHRYYDIEGEKYRSVTTILSMLSKNKWNFIRKRWNPDSHDGVSWDENRDGRATMGKYAHYRIGADLAWSSGVPICPEFDITCPLPEWLEIEYANIMRFWTDFKQSCRPVLIRGNMERAVWSHTYKYAGRLDMIVNLDITEDVFKGLRPGKDTWLIDLKTSKSRSKSWDYQIAAYMMALWEIGISTVPRAGVLWINKDGWRIEEIDIDTAIDGWKRCLNSIKSQENDIDEIAALGKRIENEFSGNDQRIYL